MKTSLFSFPLAVLTLLAGSTVACGGPVGGVLPTREGPPAPSELTLVWVGYGEAERLDEGAWKRVPAFDYELTVEQRRYADHWESVKHMRRRHPQYDGSAGPREQTLYFRVDLGAVEPSGEVPVRIVSTLGSGAGRADRTFRSSRLVFRADVSSFAPFDTYRIDQRYAYDEGKLEELVSLDKGAVPWVRNHEVATLFASHTFAEPPTRR